MKLMLCALIESLLTRYENGRHRQWSESGEAVFVPLWGKSYQCNTAPRRWNGATTPRVIPLVRGRFFPTLTAARRRSAL